MRPTKENLDEIRKESEFNCDECSKREMLGVLFIEIDELTKDLESERYDRRIAQRDVTHLTGNDINLTERIAMLERHIRVLQSENIFLEKLAFSLPSQLPDNVQP